MPEPLVFDKSLPYRDIRMTGFNALIGPMRFAPRGEEEWRFYLDLDTRHSNVVGICPGGVLMSLVDVGMGAAAFRAVGHRPVATISMSVQFVAAASPGIGRMDGSWLVRRVKTIVFMQCEAWCQDRCVLTGGGVWKVLDRTAGAARPDAPSESKDLSEAVRRRVGWPS